MPLPPALSDVVDEAIGRKHRTDPVTDTSGGPAGNARMTAWTGLILLVLALGQLVTLLDVNGLISWHIVLGTLLVPVALLKTASTTWRMGRYYTGHRPYRTAGPPPSLLRFLGPLVVLTTFGLLGSGLALVFLGQNTSHDVLFTALGQRVDTVTLHQAIFFAWAGAAGLHLITRLVPAIDLVSGRIQRSAHAAPQNVPGGSRRMGVLAATVVVAAVASALVLGASSSWRDDHGHGGRPPIGHQQRAGPLTGTAWRALCATHVGDPSSMYRTCTDPRIRSNRSAVRGACPRGSPTRSQRNRVRPGRTCVAPGGSTVGRSGESQRRSSACGLSGKA